MDRVSAALVLSAGMTLAIVAAFAGAVTDWTPAAMVALPLVAFNGRLDFRRRGDGAFSGSSCRRPSGSSRPPHGARPAARRSFVTLCKEDPRPLARHSRDAASRAGPGAGLLGAVEVFVLSDTSGADLVAREEATLLPLHGRWAR